MTTAAPDPDNEKAVKYLRRTLVDLHETRRRLSQAEGRLTEPIAIVGMGCRYPGGVRSPDDLWELVAAERDAVTALPNDRGWEIAMPSDPAATGPRRGGFVDACSFDADFFGIDAREALMMDPQQRLLLETAWEAVENAGIAPTSLRGTDTGVFVGAGTQTYAGLLFGTVPESAEGYFTTGNVLSMLSGRIAHLLGITGPALTIDTACSSSAVALHVACQALRARECSSALVGGVAVMSTPWMYLEFARQQLFALAPDGRCKSFADAADGAVFSEGVGVLLVERLSDAERLSHDVLAVVRGSAMNQDGVSNGLTAPNGRSQEVVVRRALANAGIAPSQVDVIEGHGMGTAVGDQIEAEALLAAYASEGESAPVGLGSIKSNIGHAQAAGAMAGIIKMVMAMRHGVLPKTLHVDAPAGQVDWSAGGLALLTQQTDWTKGDDQRRAAIHSFGISGTNVHVLLEEPPEVESESASAVVDVTRAVVGSTVVPWVVSGRGAASLRRQAGRLAEFAAAQPGLDIADIAHSLATTRPALDERAVVVGASLDEFVEGLTALAAGRPGPPTVTCDRRVGPCGVAFVLPDGPLDWSSVAASLVEASPVFAEEYGQVESALSRAGWSLPDALRRTATQDDDVVPLRFTVTAALAAMWRAAGVDASAVIGAGNDDAAAGYIAGRSSLDDASRLVATWDRGSVVGGDTGWLDEAVGAARERGCQAFIEFGPTQMLPDSLRADSVVVPAVGAPDAGPAAFVAALASLWTAGVAVDWRAVVADRGSRRVNLPTYGFDRRRHWVEMSPAWAAAGKTPARQPEEPRA